MSANTPLAPLGLSPRRHRGMRSTLAQRLALILVGLVLGLAALELGLRGWAWFFLARQEWRNWASTAETAAPEFRILCIGESTTALGGDDAYPRQLEGLLDTPDVRRRIRVINK